MAENLRCGLSTPTVDKLAYPGAFDAMLDAAAQTTEVPKRRARRAAPGEQTPAVVSNESLAFARQALQVAFE